MVLAAGDVVCNGHLDSRWPKLLHGTQIFAQILATASANLPTSVLEEALLRGLLRDETKFDPNTIPKGFDEALERQLSTIYLSPGRVTMRDGVGVVYATRSHAVITVKDGVVRFVEIDNVTGLRVVEEFLLDSFKPSSD